MEKYFKIPTSTEPDHCEGFFACSDNNRYILGICLSIAKQKIKLSHPGSKNLDSINAFDLAEVSQANIGQTNMIKVSSFCGPKGLIWGLDLAIAQKEEDACPPQFGDMKIFELAPLEEAFKKLTGTVEAPRFPFLPGSHVPCAFKNISAQGEKIIYSALAIGIPENRRTQACLLMEDIGEVPLGNYDIIKFNKNIRLKLIKSILEIGKNQKIRYKEVFLGIKELYVGKDEVGCALVASPYLLLAQNAIPQNKNILKLSLEEWEAITFPNQQHG